MKTLILFILCFWLLPALPACDDVAVGDYPIECIGDTVYVFPLPDDYYSIFMTRSSCLVSILRPYDDNTDIRFSDYLHNIRHVHIFRGLTDDGNSQ